MEKKGGCLEIESWLSFRVITCVDLKVLFKNEKGKIWHVFGTISLMLKASLFQCCFTMHLKNSVTEFIAKDQLAKS